MHCHAALGTKYTPSRTPCPSAALSVRKRRERGGPSCQRLHHLGDAADHTNTMEHYLPGHVRDYKLDTQFRPDGGIVHFVQDPQAPPPSSKVRECWQRMSQSIGSGGHGTVFLEKCVSPDDRCHLQRAVKVIRLSDGGARRRCVNELSTTIKFSHDRVRFPTGPNIFSLSTHLARPQVGM